MPKRIKLSKLTWNERIVIANIANAISSKHVVEALEYKTKYAIDIHRAIKLVKFLQVRGYISIPKRRK